MDWFYLIPFFILFSGDRVLEKEINYLEQNKKGVFLENKIDFDSSYVEKNIGYPSSFEPEVGKSFSKILSEKYLLDNDEEKIDLGNGPKFYVKAGYDFNGDSLIDKIAFFRITEYDFEKNIAGTEFFARLVISDEDKDGLPDKIFLDEDGDSLFDIVSDFSHKKDSMKKT